MYCTFQNFITLQICNIKKIKKNKKYKKIYRVLYNVLKIKIENKKKIIKKYIRYDVISTYFYVILTRFIKRCRHEILIKKNKKKKRKK